MTMEKRVMQLLEILHPVLLLALVCPFFYVFYKERLDSQIMPLYLAGHVLLICTAVSRIAVRKVKTFRAYLTVCTAALLLTVLLAWILGKRLFGNILSIAYVLEVAVGGLWMTVDACRIRIQGNRRQKAEKEQDINWVDQSVMTEKPLSAALVLFVICYLAALLNACPIFCDIALISGTLYLLIFLVYRQLEATENYLADTKSITNVPKQKIRRLRMGMLLASLLLACVISLFALLTRGYRTYHDLRYYDFSIGLDEEVVGEYAGQETGSFEELPEWLEALEAVPKWEMPKWLEYAGWGIAFLCLACILFFLVRGIVNYFLEFRGVPEENGDMAEALDEEVAQKIPLTRRTFLPGALSENERIRRTYRKKIRRYRKERPMACETPDEIEEKTAFPGNFAVQELHDAYEKARYGK